MRYVWITFGVAVLHRLSTIVIALIGFGTAMSSFNGPPAAKQGFSIMGIAAVLDFPVVLANHIKFWIQHDRFPTVEHWGTLGGIALKGPVLLQVAWSLCVGICVAYGVYRYRLKKYGPQPTIYWR